MQVFALGPGATSDSKMRHHAQGERESEYLMARRWLMPIAKPTSLRVSFILDQKCSAQQSSSSDSTMRKGPFSP
eukprot:7724644-Alexandrium_andersonii.AAC.1